jgi:hypothetical protein
MEWLVFFLLASINDSAIATDKYQTYEWVGYTQEQPRHLPNGSYVYEMNPVVNTLSFDEYDAFFKQRQVIQKVYARSMPDATIAYSTLATSIAINLYTVLSNDRLLNRVDLPRCVVISVDLSPLLAHIR